MAKAVKENKVEEKALEEVVKKKRASGKRKPKVSGDQTQDSTEEVDEIQPVNDAEEVISHETVGIDAEQALNDLLTEELNKVSGSNAVGVTEEQIEEAESMPEVIMEQPTTVLSKHASNWVKWLEYQKMTPEQFLTKYPMSKMKHFIQEIIDFNAKK